MGRKKRESLIERVAVVLRRGVEVVLGATLLLGTVVPILAIAGVAYELLFESLEMPLWAIPAILIPTAGLAWFCLVIGWRLLSGRERPGGGLLHPWFLYVEAFYLTWYGTGRGLLLGPEYAQMYHAAAADSLKMARERRRRRPPNNRLQPTAPVDEARRG